MPYDVEAERAVAHEVGMPAYDEWVSEVREGIYRGEMHSGRSGYHREPRA